MSESVCRWGFLSTAGIARKNWKGVRLSGNGRVSAVASRSVEKAQRFIDECSAEVPQSQPVEAVGSYAELLQRDDVDAVYIPLPTGMRKEWVIAAAEAGKHVLCEKPVAINADDAAEMIEACDNAGVQFMDGVMFDHSARIQEVVDRVHSGEAVGRMRRIASHFSFAGDPAFVQSNIRTDSTLEPHGCLGDLGWYNIRFTLWLTRFTMPTTVTARMLSSLGGDASGGQVPGEMVAELQFPDGVSASFYCSFLTINQQTAHVSGDQGYVSLDDFVLPLVDSEVAWQEHAHVLEIDNCRWNFGRRSQRHAIAEYHAGESNSQETVMLRRLADIALSGTVDPQYSSRALQTQTILDACRQSAIAGGKVIELT